MNIADAIAVNCLLRHFLGIAGPAGKDDPSHAREAAEQLAERAYKALSAGVRPSDVLENWGRRRKVR